MVSHPVIFHQKDSVAKILKKQKMRFHLTSCHLPKLQSKERRKIIKKNISKPPIKYSPSCGKQNIKSSFKFTGLQLKGSQIHSPRFMTTKQFIPNTTGALSGEEMNTHLHKEMYTGRHEKYLPDSICNTNTQSHRSMDISPESNQASFAQNVEYVHIPVSVPNPALTDESCSVISEEARHVKPDMILDNADQKHEIASKEKVAANDIRYSPDSDNTEKNKNTAVSKIIEPVAETWCDKIGKESFKTARNTTVPAPCLPTLRKRIISAEQDLPASSFPNSEERNIGRADKRLLKSRKRNITTKDACQMHVTKDACPTSRERNIATADSSLPTSGESCDSLRRVTSRITYIPSTPSFVQGGEIIELPKGVPPSKALMELRQTFCENIRRETEQLEFDLQELYLKKQLHQR